MIAIIYFLGVNRVCVCVCVCVYVLFHIRVSL